MVTRIFLKQYRYGDSNQCKNTHEFELLYIVLTCSTTDVLQDYINRISLPKLISGHPDDPLGKDMQLILTTTKSQDPKEIDNAIERFLENGFQKDLETISKLELEP